MKLLPIDKRNSECSCCGNPFAKYEFDGKLFCNKCVLIAMNDSMKRKKEEYLFILVWTKTDYKVVTVL